MSHDGGRVGLRRALEALLRLVALRLEERAPPPEARNGSDRLLVRPLDAPESVDLSRLFSMPSEAGPLSTLLERYGLLPEEIVAVVAAVAPEVDGRFAVLYGMLTDRPGVTHLTGEVLGILLSRTLGGRLDTAHLLAPGSRLQAIGLLRFEEGEDTLLSGRIRLDPRAVAWLLGWPTPEPEFSPAFPAHRIRTVHTLDDLVLPPDSARRLRHVVERIRYRDTVLEEWGFRKHHDHAEGYTVFLHGSPGTGKTTAAAAVGRETGRPVYRIDLSAIVSKYIGETEKNLASLFDQAETQEWILFFDEADALFGKRSEVRDSRDRFANQQVSYLLQRLEIFSGVSLLASNFRENVDDAFLRRIHLQVHFPDPDAAERERLWSRMMPPALPVAGDVDLEGLAERFAMTGGEIRNAVFHAAFRAAANGGRVTREVLLQGIRNEFEKAGRMLPPTEAVAP